MSKDDFYAVLGVAPTASLTEIKERFRFLSHAYHPDKFATDAQRRAAEHEFKRVNEAYGVLSDAGQRARFDATRSHSASAGPSRSPPPEPPPTKRQPRTPGTRAWVGIVLIACIVGIVWVVTRLWPSSTGGDNTGFLDTRFGMSSLDVGNVLQKHGAELMSYDEYRRSDPSPSINNFGFIPLFSDDRRKDASLYMPAIEMYDSKVEAEFGFREGRLASVGVHFDPIAHSKTELVLATIEASLRSTYKFSNREDTRRALWAAFHSGRCWRVQISTASPVSASGDGKRPVRPCCQTGASLAECGIAPLQTLLYWLQIEAPRLDGGTGWNSPQLGPAQWRIDVCKELAQGTDEADNVPLRQHLDRLSAQNIQDHDHSQPAEPDPNQVPIASRWFVLNLSVRRVCSVRIHGATRSFYFWITFPLLSIILGIHK